MEIPTNSTPINVDTFKKNLMTIESSVSSNKASFHIDKYSVILGISVLTFIAGLSFWVFVTYML